MRRFALILVLAALATASPAPEPKKYKPEVKETKTNSSLTNEERQFLREVEAKFGIKPDVPKDEKSDQQTTKSPKGDLPKLPFPAVIAIEIVNDTDSKGKGKRTIDANLGYGYRTNTGYSYSYFGKPQEKGKFMLYPYSQEDIPAARPNNQNHGYTKGSYTTPSPNVEIQPSQAYELVPVKENQPSSYEYKKPSTEFKSGHENVKGLESPPPAYTPGQSPHTLYTTYNGDNFSGLSGQFPAVMPNYFVDTSQLLKSPQYQSAGLTSDYIRSHGSQLEQKVVPVLVLRIPSSYLKNPSAELYANLPQNYPVSQYLNNVNLQELVNQYFSKIGYSVAPQIMSYNHSPLSAPVSAPAATAQASGQAQYEPQHYANPYVQPSYTQSDYSGVQYSAVQPVMAKYPPKHSPHQYYMTQAQPIYRQPVQSQEYGYQYRYVPSPEVHQQYYVNNVDPEYQQQISSHESYVEQATGDQETSVQHAAGHARYEESQAARQQSHTAHEVPHTPHYRQQHHESQQYQAEPEYELSKEDPKNDSPTKVSVSAYSTPKPQYGSPQEQQQYYSPKEPIQKETIAIYPSSPESQTIQRYQFDPQSGLSQNYYYQKQVGDDSASKTIVISENYPSKDHTIATVLPFHKTTSKTNKPLQTVNYVTPEPFSLKYQSRYNIMVPQTVLGGATKEKVSYVNSHSLPANYFQSGSQYNPEEEYTTALNHVPARSSQKAPSYPKNYHSQPKRMVKPENRSESPSSSASSSRKRNEKNDKNKSS